MALYLVQHGQCHSKEIDPAKGLTEAGRDTARRIASVAKGYKVPVTCILHSGKKRARQTAEIFAEALAPPKVCIPNPASTPWTTSPPWPA
jgi:phosphohistidine phosphatase